jgi:tetratricopeptide (TPR) repeat protein
VAILTWQNDKGNYWTHDRAIALGQLSDANLSPSPEQWFRVTERLSMLPPADLPAGTYTLTGKYRDRRTGATQPLAIPPIRLQIDPQAPPAPAPELDLISQLIQLGGNLRTGKLDPVFAEIGRINQYDPVQDYIAQAQVAISDRLTQPKILPNLAYALGLAYALQRQAQPATDTFTAITRDIDPSNPWAWAYLGFLHLYSFHPQAAEQALATAVQLNPNLREVKILRIVAAAMSGNLPLAWDRYHALQATVH